MEELLHGGMMLEFNNGADLKSFDLSWEDAAVWNKPKSRIN